MAFGDLFGIGCCSCNCNHPIRIAGNCFGPPGYSNTPAYGYPILSYTIGGVTTTIRPGVDLQPTSLPFRSGDSITIGGNRPGYHYATPSRTTTFSNLRCDGSPVLVSGPDVTGIDVGLTFATPGGSGVSAYEEYPDYHATVSASMGGASVTLNVVTSAAQIGVTIPAVPPGQSTVTATIYAPDWFVAEPSWSGPNTFYYSGCVDSCAGEGGTIGWYKDAAGIYPTSPAPTCPGSYGNSYGAPASAQKAAEPLMAANIARPAGLDRELIIARHTEDTRWAESLT